MPLTSLVIYANAAQVVTYLRNNAIEGNRQPWIGTVPCDNNRCDKRWKGVDNLVPLAQLNLLPPPWLTSQNSEKTTTA